MVSNNFYRGRALGIAVGITIMALAVAALASALAPIFSDEFTTIWNEFSIGTVNNKLIVSENDKLKISFGSDDFGAGWAGLKSKNAINVIPSTIEFTTELDNTNDSGNPYAEYAAVFAISTDPLPNNNPPCCEWLLLFQNALVIVQDNEGNRGIIEEAHIMRDGAMEELASSGYMPFDINPETKWKIVLQSRNDIKIYKNDALFYENSSLNFPNDYAYIYTYMWSSTSQGRYVLFDYVRVTPLKGKNH